MAATKKTEEKVTPKKDYSTLNVFQKLQLARSMFLEAGAKKTGKNMHMAFMYFELEDIVPIAEPIFTEVGLVMIPRISGDEAAAVVHNVDNPAEMAEFILPYTPISPIVTNAGKQATNEMQATGSSITYIRRYLWMIVLDIVEADTIDPNIGANAPSTAASAPKEAPAKAAPKATVPKAAPATAVQRQEIKAEVTAPDAPADPLQITALKNALKSLRETDPDQEGFIQQVAIKTKAFTEISKTQCEQLIAGVAQMIAEYKKG